MEEPAGCLKAPPPAPFRELLRIWNEVIAAALFQIIQSSDLPGHLEVTPIHRVMPSLDINGTFKAAPA